jgi:pyrroloquinoline quinone biosynthesis protein D
MTASDTLKLARKARLRFDRHDERWMIVYPERGLVLSESAAAIARKLDGTRSLEQLTGELAAERGADPADVRAFVDALGRKGLLER